MTTAPYLVEITPANLEAALAIRVSPEQERLVRPVISSLAEAYVHPDVAWPRLILDGERPVGFLMAFFGIRFSDRERPDIRSGLWRLNIAAGEQGRGYGRFAVIAVADEIRKRGGNTLTVSFHPGPGGPEGFYYRLGFRPTGEVSGDQTVAELDLS